MRPMNLARVVKAKRTIGAVVGEDHRQKRQVARDLASPKTDRVWQLGPWSCRRPWYSDRDGPCDAVSCIDTQPFYGFRDISCPHAGECLKLARTAFSAYDRRNLLAADWYALADMVAKRAGEVERMRSPADPEPAPEPVAARPKKPRQRRTAREGSPSALKVSVQRAHSSRAQKSRT